MGMFASIAKWKLRWALVTGAFTLIVLPIFRLIFKRKTTASSSKKSDDVIDVKAEEVK